MFNQTLCTLDHHLGNSFVMLRQLIKGRIDYFYIISDNGFLDVGNFLRTLVDQQNDQVHIWVISKDGLCHLF